MSWQSKILGLCKKYGSSAKFAVTTVLGTVIPGSPALVALIEQAFDAAKQTAQDDWEISVSKQLDATAADVARIEQVLTIVGENLMQSLEVVSRLESLPDMAKQQLATSLTTDARTQETLRKLNEVAKQFDVLTEQYRSLLAQQGYTTQAVNELLPLLRRLSGLAGVMDEIQKAVFSQQDSITSLQAYIQASNAIAAGKIDEATNLLKGLSATHPNLSGPHLSLAAALVVKKDLPDAQKAVFRFIQLRPQDKEIARLDLAMAMGNSEEVNLLVPGTWMSQKIGKPDAKWVEVTALPAKVVLDPTEHYTLKVASSARDMQLAGLQDISTLDSLIAVSFSGCAYLKGDGLAYLSGCQSLQSLDFGECGQLANSLSHLKNVANLRSLSLQGCKRITDADLSILRLAPHLESLDLTGCAQITDKAFEGLSIPRLRWLKLEGCPNLTDKALAFVAQCTDLKGLILSGCGRITDASMSVIAHCRCLQSLWLDDCSNLSDSGLNQLGMARLSSLESLSLKNCQRLTDMVLYHLRPCTGIKYLGLQGCSRIEAPIGLQHYDNLELVDVTRTRVVKEILLVLKKKLPYNCTVVTDHTSLYGIWD